MEECGADSYHRHATIATRQASISFNLIRDHHFIGTYLEAKAVPIVKI